MGTSNFCVPKPDNTARIVADLRELNKQVEPTHYPLPKIQDIFHRRRGFKYMTKIDVSMHFHAFALDEDSSWKCVIVTPFGKFRYLRLPMGLINSHAWAQGQMMLIFKDMLDEVEIYIAMSVFSVLIG